jgi:predicted HAD superfamily Cof-like phosphohydrolase
MVREFMQMFGQETPDKQAMLNDGQLVFRFNLTKEENQELRDSKTLTDVFDAVLDKLYVTFGDAVAAGFTAEDASRGFAEVHRSNMSKLWTWEEVSTSKFDHGTTINEIVSQHDKRFLVKRADGKVIKSPSHSRPNFTGIIK